jgi:predicted ATPase/DNA-binding CsgD family transcriptional regulator
MNERVSVIGNRLAETLTNREVDILSLLAQNLSDREIAAKRSLALSSVKWYAQQIYNKLGVNNRHDAAVIAKEMRLVHHNDVKPPSTQHPARLPRHLSTFIGREKEIARVVDLLMDHQLVTLTGPGGVGKTRLALAVAENLLPFFSDNLWFIELASLSDPDLIWQTLSEALEVREQPGVPLPDSLMQYLEGIQGLFVIDNCEHLIETCSQVASTLVQASTRLRVVSSSRESLGLPGEVIYKVPSLAFPATQEDIVLEDFLQYDAVKLFINRAQAVNPDFKITSQEARFVTQICRRLDGIPLAIELAASRVTSMDLEQIATRLDGMFRLLSGSSRTMVDRHRTLRNTMDWSYQLLTVKERALLRRLSIFAGSWTLEAAEQVCSAGDLAEEEVFDLLSQLVNKSMVATIYDHNQRMRYRLLETVRHYAIEKLVDSGENLLFRERHARWFIRLAEAIGRIYFHINMRMWRAQYEPDFDNFRAALEWLLGDGQDSNAALRFSCTLGSFFEDLSNWGEAIYWLNRSLALNREQYPLSPAQVNAMIRLVRSNIILSTQQVLDEVQPILAYCDQLGDAARLEKGMALNLQAWTMAIGTSEMQEALAIYNESEKILREFHSTALDQLLEVLIGKSYIYYCLDDLDQAEILDIEGRALFADHYGPDKMYCGSVVRADIAFKRGNYDLAANCFRELLEQNRITGSSSDVANLVKKIGNTERLRGNEIEAITYHQECIKTKVTDVKGGLEVVLHFFECLAFDEAALGKKLPGADGKQHLQRAACLLGFDEGQRETLNIPLFFEHRAEYDQTIKTLQAGLTPDTLQAMWDQGRKMDMKQASQFALEDGSSLAP